MKEGGYEAIYDHCLDILVASNLLMNENPTASKTFLRPSAPMSLELTSFATCKNIHVIYSIRELYDLIARIDHR